MERSWSEQLGHPELIEGDRVIGAAWRRPDGTWCWRCQIPGGFAEGLQAHREDAIEQVERKVAAVRGELRALRPLAGPPLYPGMPGRMVPW
jgi:hypothetical protein